MSTFAEKCANPIKPDYTKDCADKIISSLSLDKSAIDSCISNEVAKPTKTVGDSFKIQSQKMTLIPSITLNKMKYKVNSI